MDSHDNIDGVPKNFDRWMDRSIQLKVAHVNPSDPSSINAASEITKEFISMRAIGPNCSPANTFPFPKKGQVRGPRYWKV
ncbi:hypothetical protein N7530_006640 [Penicillium desertorum]|uniref:Uncharacterized protein n=1 Tax=Penicillium desertorum TaxID=1303715 RepID=A0A9W9WS56_9EURO|nr:hypothetical protein N7530_006640 [Penicillium desertorum]